MKDIGREHRRAPQGGARGVILAGGASRRMGTDKALVRIRDRPMILHVADALGAAGATPVVVVGGSRELDALDLDVIPDRWPGEGPLGGILTGLDAGTGDALVVACDMPALDATTLSLLVGVEGDHDAVVAVAEGVRQPLLACYRPSAAAPLRAAWERGERAPSRVLDTLRLVEVSVSVRAAASVDTPADVAAAQQDTR